jgi:hypothetical protein
MIRSRGEALESAVGPEGQALGPTIRITAAEVISWGMDADDDP